MTTLYFVRHAQPDLSIHDDFSRPLSPRGREDRMLAVNYLRDKGVKAVFSSPYRRAVDTVSPLAKELGLPVAEIPGFRERRVGPGWIEDFDGFARRQWADFTYKLPGGESLEEVQTRCLEALSGLLTERGGVAAAIGCHGTALCTLIHRFTPSFGYGDFAAMKDLMPWIVVFRFQGMDFISLEAVDLRKEL